ncbi:MAG: site-specific DNA-methyltransferase [Nitrospira sp.]|nr:site-specific DNA-methyltransferase [Nitrospira sp.]
MTHQVYAMDNRELERIPDSVVQFTVTSPPYVTTKFERGQEFDYDGFIRHFRKVCEEVFRVTVPGGRFALNVADIITKYRYLDDSTISRIPFGSDTLQVAQAAGFRLLERFIWDKGFTRNFGGPLLGSYPYPLTIFNQNYFEYIWVLQKPGKRRVTQDLRERSKISLDEWRAWTQQWWRVESISEKFKLHPAVFPVEIPYRLIRMYSYEGDTILDPYMGTGASMLAANRCGRKFIGFEIDPDCLRLVEERIAFDLQPLLEESPIYEVIQ